MDLVWRKVSVHTGELEEWSRIHTEFEQLFGAAGSPADAGMFIRTEPGLPRVELLFSPGAYRIARPLVDANRGVPCDKPPKDGTRPLVQSPRGRSPLD